jgi:hypothetical protein
VLYLRPFRVIRHCSLMYRLPASHGENRGSSPLGSASYFNGLDECALRRISLIDACSGGNKSQRMPGNFGGHRLTSANPISSTSSLQICGHNFFTPASHEPCSIITGRVPPSLMIHCRAAHRGTYPEFPGSEIYRPSGVFIGRFICVDEIPPATGSGSRSALECWDTTVSEFAGHVRNKERP